MEEGRVRVNGRQVTTPGYCIDPEKDNVEVDGKPIKISVGKVYILFYKPRLCITSARDPQGRKTVFHYVQRPDVRLFPVGRLDYDAEGLLLMTNDGELANRLQHPRHGVAKVYEVKMAGHISDEALRTLAGGVTLEEGTTAPADVVVMRKVPGAVWVRMTLHQGWNRQIKRMGQAVGHPVLKIKRVGYGPLTLGRLAPGEFRELDDREVSKLQRLVDIEERRFRGS